MEKTIKITDSTKISALIKADKACIDAIARVAKPFYRLKNPILRKVMASRVNIAEAAKMGGCTVADIAAALAPLGFEYEAAATGEAAVQARPEWLTNTNENDIIRYDVRPIIESGTDPLKEILSRFKEVPSAGILCIINSFVPAPLIHLLEQEKAAGSYVETVSPREFHTYFLKREKESPAKTAQQRNLPGEQDLKKESESAAKTAAGDKVIMDDAASFDAVYRRFSKEQIRETDVRHLEMPLPMQTILSALAELPEGHMLYVHHKRIPVYLLEELADKHYEVHIHTVDDHNVKMILFEKQ